MPPVDEQPRLTLYSVTENLLALLDSLDLCESPEQRAACEMEIGLAVEVQIQKTDSFNHFLSHLESQAALAEKEIARLEARQAGFLRSRDRLVAYAIRTMKALGLRKLEGATTLLQLRQNRPAVEIRDETQIPARFQIVRQQVSWDKNMIKQAIDNGETVPGASLREPTTSLIRR